MEDGGRWRNWMNMKPFSSIIMRIVSDEVGSRFQILSWKSLIVKRGGSIMSCVFFSDMWQLDMNMQIYAAWNLICMIRRAYIWDVLWHTGVLPATSCDARSRLERLSQVVCWVAWTEHGEIRRATLACPSGNVWIACKSRRKVTQPGWSDQCRRFISLRDGNLDQLGAQLLTTLTDSFVNRASNLTSKCACCVELRLKILSESMSLLHPAFNSDPSCWKCWTCRYSKRPPKPWRRHGYIFFPQGQQKLKRTLGSLGCSFGVYNTRNYNVKYIRNFFWNTWRLMQVWNLIAPSSSQLMRQDATSTNRTGLVAEENPIPLRVLQLWMLRSFRGHGITFAQRRVRDLPVHRSWDAGE